MTTDNCAVYINGTTPRDTLDSGCRWITGTPYHFSNYGKHIDYSTDVDNAAHYITPLNSSFSRAVVFHYGMPLPPGKPLAGVLSHMLTRMGPGGQIFLQNRRLTRVQPWLPKSFFRHYLPHVRVRRTSLFRSYWLRLEAAGNTAQNLCKLKTLYPALANSLPQYRDRWLSFNSGSETAYTLSHLLTPCYRGLMESGVLEVMIRDAFADRTLSGLDVGGGIGYISCELAAWGHSMINHDLNRRSCWMAEWLRDICGLQDRVGIVQGDMQQLDEVPGSYDFVSFMGSLLFCRDKDPAGVLSSAAHKLLPGGRLFLTENVTGPDTKKSARRQRFEARQFHELVSSFAKPQYYDHYARRISTDTALKSSKIFCSLDCGPQNNG